MAELMQMVMRLIQVRSNIAACSVVQPYMVEEADELEREIAKLARRMEVL